MNQLVFLEPNDIKEEPFTTLKVVSESSGVSHKKVKMAISKNKTEIESFGLLDLYETESTGGRPEIIYKLNEPQATFLITLLKNTPQVVKFKQLLVKQFYIMQKGLNSRRVTREIAKQSREALTDAINQLPDSPHKNMKYKHYTDLIYKIVFGKTSKQLKAEYGITGKENLRDRFTADQIMQVEKIEQQVSAFINMEYDYQQIKAEFTKKYRIAV